MTAHFWVCMCVFVKFWLWSSGGIKCVRDYTINCPLLTLHYHFIKRLCVMRGIACGDETKENYYFTLQLFWLISTYAPIQLLSPDAF